MVGKARTGSDTGLIENLRVRHDGWTPARQRTFLRALAEMGCMRDACARAGISNNSAYRMKKRSAPFSRAWGRALAKAMPTIEQAAYERAVIGWDEPIVQGGKLVGHKRRCPLSLHGRHSTRRAIRVVDRGAIAIAAIGLHKSLCPLLF